MLNVRVTYSCPWGRSVVGFVVKVNAFIRKENKKCIREKQLVSLNPSTVYLYISWVNFYPIFGPKLWWIIIFFIPYIFHSYERNGNFPHFTWWFLWHWPISDVPIMAGILHTSASGHGTIPCQLANLQRVGVKNSGFHTSPSYPKTDTRKSWRKRRTAVILDDNFDEKDPMKLTKWSRVPLHQSSNVWWDVKDPELRRPCLNNRWFFWWSNTLRLHDQYFFQWCVRKDVMIESWSRGSGQNSLSTIP